jgi:transposase
MLTISRGVRIYVCTAPADMRRSFDGLARMAEDEMGQDPFTGHLFVFRNRRGDRVKILYWDRDGYAIWYKRLEEGTFRFPESGEGRVEVERSALLLLLDGMEWKELRRRRRYRRAVV